MMSTRNIVVVTAMTGVGAVVAVVLVLAGASDYVVAALAVVGGTAVGVYAYRAMKRRDAAEGANTRGPRAGVADSMLRDDFPLMSKEELEREARLRPRRRRFSGSTAEWLAGYAVIFLILGIVALTEAKDGATLVIFGAALVLAVASILVWRREKSRPP